MVHAGGVRAGNTTTVNPLPNGAVFTATEVGNPAVAPNCTTSGGTGTCSITVPAGFQWNVTETTPPPGYYLSGPNLDSGTSAAVSSFPYAFRTATLNGTTTVDVPGPANMPNGTFTSNGQTFSQQLATSLNDPPAVMSCGLNIALVLDQSGSMAQNGKQAALQTAANEAITDLTGTPSTVAIYTFGPTTGVSIAKTSTINATSAAPLHTFINSLPAPAGGTNWDQGLAQVASGFDEVIFLTDGAPTGSRIRTNNFAQSLFTDTEQGIFSANGIKAGGERIVGVGIGLNGGADNLRAVSGPTENQDFFLPTDTDFGTILKQLATGACNNQLTITKQIQDPSGALINPTPADANGWTFTNTISAGSTVASPVTTAAVNGANGIASAAVTIPAGATPTVSVTETLKAGYNFVTAQCSVGGTNVATTITGTKATFTGAADEPMACTFTNKRLPPVTIATTPSPGGPAGTTSITDTATVSGGVTPTGTVTFSLYPPGNTTCTGTPAFTSTNGLTGTPPKATSGAFATAAAGTWQWVAKYNGDANNMAVSSACGAEPVTITQATPTIATSATPGGPVGTSITDTATVSGGSGPTGTVTFSLYPPGNATCTGTPAFTSTNALSATPPFTSTSGAFAPGAVGTYHWVAEYNGDANNVAVSSGCTAEPVTLTQATPTIATSATPGGPVGTSITDTATVSGGASPTGAVTFRLFAPGNATCTGTPAFTSTSPLSATPPFTATSGAFAPGAVGTYHWVATYDGDANNVAVSSGCTAEPVTITQAAPTITTTPTPGGPVGTLISDTATVSGGASPTGTVTFNLYPPGNATCTGTPAFTSTNPLAVTPPFTSTSTPFPTGAVGTYHWVATYNGDANNMTASSGCTAEPVTIAQAVPTIATTPTPSSVVVGGSITDTATVSGGFNPTGTVTFNLFAPGNATCTGTPAFTSTNPLAVTPPFTSTSGPFVPGAVGTWHWVATYNGDANNVPASSVCGTESVTVTQAAPTIATTPTPSSVVVGGSITDTATVSGGHSPTGTVTFNLFAPGNATCTGTPVSTSTIALSGTPPTSTSDPFTTAAVGTYQWVATYNGDANNMAASSVCGSEPVTVTQATPTIATTPTPSSVVVGGSITDTATVSGGHSPTGTVTFNLFAPGNATCTGTPAFTSTNPLAVTPPFTSTSGPFVPGAVGTWHWVATYNGDANNMTASSGCPAESVTVTQAAPTIATTPTPSSVVVGGSITDTATVSGGHSPTGTVTFNLFAPGNATCTGTPAFTSTNPLSRDPALHLHLGPIRARRRGHLALGGHLQR